ncbi:MAG: penicillin-insensitive murein endopeptidase [Deltaproteobacteria bacterium]|nr:penicillin-insensitive murein endopeptidase [Deltaproteobacteria bacterium]
METTPPAATASAAGTDALETLRAALERGAGWVASRPWRHLAALASRRFVSLTIALGLAIVPGSLLLAVAALVWHRLAATAPLAYQPTSPRVVQQAPGPPPAAEVSRPAAEPARPATATPVTPPPPPRAPAPAPSSPLILPPPEALSKETAAASCSGGTRSRGPLEHAAHLEDAGAGYRLIFPHRQLAYGTDELVGAITRIASRLGASGGEASAPLMVGNLSGPAGSQAGQDPFHPALYSLSHGAGRAADLAFPLVDALGRPVAAVETALAFEASGRSEAGVRRLHLPAAAEVPPGCRRNRIRSGLAEVTCLVPEGAYAIDYARGWQLIRTLLLDPEIGVIDDLTGVSRPDGSGLRFVFVAPFIEEGLLAAAEAAGEPEGLRKIAAQLLHQPSNADPYVHYFHVELWCTAEDRAACGCDDGTPPWKRWRAGVQLIPVS